jgi:hypothetical protein
MKRVPIFWNIQMTVRPPQNPYPRFDAMLGLACNPEHPALAHFPTEINCDWEWTPLIDNVCSVNLSSAPRTLKPIVAAIDDWNRNWRLGVIFECKVGAGNLLVSAIPVNTSNGSSGLQQLRRSLLDYMSSAKFAPTVALSVNDARQLLFNSQSQAAEPTHTRVLDPDLDDGSGRPNQTKSPKP